MPPRIAAGVAEALIWKLLVGDRICIVRPAWKLPVGDRSCTVPGADRPAIANEVAIGMVTAGTGG